MSFKRILDIVLGSALLLAVLPFGLLLALLVRADSPGPAFFRQRRIGYNGRPFHILKFRTMHVLEDGPIVIQAQRRDPRVTRIGRLLRVTSLDELPQLINVLAGDMSLVGPRPHAAAHDDYYGRHIPNYAYRRRVRPGITGWAQIHGARGATPNMLDMQARVDLDAWYVDNGSVALDLVILARTAVEVLHGRRD